MRRNLAKKQGQAFFCLLACLVVLISCADDPSHDREVAVFHLEDVSCTDQVTLEAKTKMKLEDLNPARKISDTSIEGYIARNKTLADQGWPHAMLSFGSALRGRVKFLNRYDDHDHTQKILPTSTKDDMVLRLSYIYLAAAIESPYKGNALWMLEVVESNSGFPKTPPAWIDEAKTNVENWKVGCAEKQMEIP